jgi:hypothetical protein
VIYKGDFCLLSSHVTGSGVHPISCPVGTVGSFPGAKVAGREADHSPVSSALVKSDGTIPPLFHVPSRRGA